MRIPIVTFLLLLFGAVAHAQTTPTHVHFEHGSLHWAYSGAGQSGFNVKCTHTDAAGNPVTAKQIANPTTRSIVLTAIPLTIGEWSCVVDAYDATHTSGNSNAVTLTVENFLPAPTSIHVQ